MPSESSGIYPDSEDDNSPVVKLKSHADRLLAEAGTELSGPDALLILLHGTTLASSLRSARPDISFSCFTPEHFFLRTLRQFHPDLPAVTPECSSVAPAGPALYCSADLPERQFDSIVFPTHAGDSSEQAQELFQSACLHLKAGGCLFVSTNNARDRWVGEQLRGLFRQVDVRKFPHGVVYKAVRGNPPKRIRGFRARFGFRCGDRILMCESRPGVFSHRRVDGGARALIKSLSLISSAAAGSQHALPTRIIDMGSGCGSVSVAAAVIFPEAQILAVDSDARAVECTAASARLNDLTSISTLLNSTGEVPDPGAWDLLLGNPPYYSDFRIAELFLQTARQALCPGGRLRIVTKATDWLDARMRQLFRDVTAHEFGEYTVFSAHRK